MKNRKNVLAACCALASACAALPAAAAPLSIEGGLPIEMRGVVAAADQDVQRQGYVTAYRSASLRSAMQGRGRPRVQAVLSFAAALDATQFRGWTVTTAVATAGIFAPLISGLVPSTRSDSPPGAAATLVSSFNVGEVGRLDDGTRAVQRVIDGARAPSDRDDIAAMLSSTP